MTRMIEKIISGGQTSTDRAALDFAIKHKYPAWWLDSERAENQGWDSAGKIPSPGNAY